MQYLANTMQSLHSIADYSGRVFTLCYRCLRQNTYSPPGSSSQQHHGNCVTLIETGLLSDTCNNYLVITVDVLIVVSLAPRLLQCVHD